MKNLILLSFLFCLACQTETPQNTTTNKAPVYTLSDYFLLRYTGQLENKSFFLHIANWADGTCSGNWYNPYLKKEMILKGQVNLAEQLELGDLTGNKFVFNFSTPEKITGHFKKANTSDEIPITLEAQPNCSEGLFPTHFFSDEKAHTWIITCIEKSRYIVAVAVGTRHALSLQRRDVYFMRYANLKNKKLVFETKDRYCDFIYKNKEGVIKVETQKDCSKLDAFVSF